MFVKFNKISIHKRKIVIDIRDFNVIFMLDFFLNDIIILFQKTTHIIVMNATKQFHQFLIKEENRHKLRSFLIKKKSM